MGCSIPIVVLYLDYQKKKSIYELHHRERMAAIDKGMEVPPLPPELFNGSHRASGPSNYLLKGLVWTAIGIGSMIALRQLHEEVNLIGVIPLGIGLAYLVYYAVEGRKLRVQAQKGATPAPPAV
jgi:hypothetical protein